MTLVFIVFFGVITSHPPSGVKTVQTEEPVVTKNPPLRSMDDKSTFLVPHEAKSQIKEDPLSNHDDQFTKNMNHIVKPFFRPNSTPPLHQAVLSVTAALTLTENYSHHEIDSDGNNLINSLVFYAEFNVTIADRYYFLYGIYPTEFESSSNQQLQVDWTPGIHNISASWVMGKIAYSKQLVSSYYIGPILWGTEPSEYTNTFYPDYTTRVYNYTEFDPPSVFLTGNYYDEGMDTGEDGLFDYLAFICEVNVTMDGTYEINLWVEEEQDRFLDAGNLRGTRKFFSPGIYNVTFLYPCIELYVNQWTTFFLFDLVSIVDESGRTSLGEAFNVYTTRVYHYTELDPWAVLTGHYTDQGRDTDNDSYFNAVEFRCEINVSVAEEYIFSISCHSLIGGYSWNLKASQFVSRGIQNISILIPVDESNLTSPLHYNTSYIIDSVSIEKANVDRKNTIVDEKLNNVHFTRTYTYTEFVPLEVSEETYLTNSSSDTPVTLDDTNESVTQQSVTSLLFLTNISGLFFYCLIGLTVILTHKRRNK